MTRQFLHDHTSHKENDDNGSLLRILIGLIGLVVGLTILQDFLEAERNGYSFYITESVLFKTLWILFVPILAFLKIKLENEKLHTLFKSSVYITTPIVIHLLLYFILFRLFSYLFYNDRYDLLQIFTYTFANDLYKIVLVYVTFVISYKFYRSRSDKLKIPYQGDCLEYITVNNGKRNTVVKVNDIVQITSANPYISIELEDKSYLHTETLRSLCNKLDRNKFLRVHKSSIVNIKKVVSYTSRLNGDYDLTLTNGVEVRLSRTYAAGFKNLLNAHQVTV